VTRAAPDDLAALPLAHWVAHCPDERDWRPTVRIRIYRPLQHGIDTDVLQSVNVPESGESTLLRHFEQRGKLHIAERWSPVGDVPALIAEVTTAFSVVHTRTLAAGRVAELSTGYFQQPSFDSLALGMAEALRDDRRQVASLAAMFLSNDAVLHGCLVQAGRRTDRVRFDVLSPAGRPVVRGIARFGCGVRHDVQSLFARTR
jgi:hypothetical protein